MAVQFGRWNVEGKSVDPDYIRKVCALIAPYSSEAAQLYSVGGISMVYCAFPTTTESFSDLKPLQFASGAILTWDGRLDNREQLINDLGRLVSAESTDASIVAASYVRWGSACFARLIGDWALAIWDPDTRSLFLARDFTGIRPLYYTCGETEITWCTVLDPLVLLAGKRFKIEEEYLAGWLASFPDAHLTPYVGVLAVPPASFIEWRPERMRVRTHWTFDPGKEIRYGTDEEYEAHFRTLFAQSVRRRLRSNAAVLGELSGGMDSTSIICMADLISRDRNEGVNVETISYYSGSEPNWDERPYFTMVEEARGRTGFHVEMDWSGLFKVDPGGRFYAIPAALAMPRRIDEQLGRHIVSQGFRVVLSGFGGDEVLGGVPTPIPELANLLAEARVLSFARRLKLWALSSRKPLLQLLFEVLTAFLPNNRFSDPANSLQAHWFTKTFVRRYRSAFRGYSKRLTLFGPRPSFLENINALQSLRRQIGCFPSPTSPPYEKRYPYLDRDLLEFIYAIPREQLIRPGERRSLMKRALARVVPQGVLHRKRKSSISKAPHMAIAEGWDCLVRMSEQPVIASLGIVDKPRLVEALEKAKRGDGVAMVPLMRTILLEMWLAHLSCMELLGDGDRPPVEQSQDAGDRATARA
jgi:asparagine synthase (glutamine-hydrolysing)